MDEHQEKYPLINTENVPTDDDDHIFEMAESAVQIAKAVLRYPDLENEPITKFAIEFVGRYGNWRKFRLSPAYRAIIRQNVGAEDQEEA